MTKKTFLILPLIGLAFLCNAQRNNYVLQNAPLSYGFFVNVSPNSYVNKELKDIGRVGFGQGFGLSLFHHKKRFAIETGIAYGVTTLRTKEDLLLDSQNILTGYRSSHLSFPINFNFKSSNNKRRTILILGIQPGVQLKSRLLVESEDPRHEINNQLFIKRGRNFWLNANIGMGKSYDLNPNVMMRVSLEYKPAWAKIHSNNFMVHQLGLKLHFMNHN